jgi:trigger factor
MLSAMLIGCKTSETDMPSASAETPADTAFSYSDGIDENGYWDGINARDYVEMFDYGALRVPADAARPTDEEVQSEIANILARFEEERRLTDRAVINGDTVNIDFVGSIDGVEFAGGSTNGAGTDVTIGVTSYIDDFLEQLIGHMPGETVNVEVTFPDDYQETSLQGKDALFVTVINYIKGAATDDFVEKYLSGKHGWKTVAEMESGVSEILVKRMYIENYFTSGVSVKEVPSPLIDYQEDAMIAYYEAVASYYGMELMEFVNSSVDPDALTEEDFLANFQDISLRNATFYLVVQAIAEDLGLTVSEDDLVYYFMTSDYAALAQDRGLPFYKQNLIVQKVMDYTVENAVAE